MLDNSTLAQTTNEISIDTTLASQYIEQAQNIAFEADEKLELTSKALKIYQAYPGLPKLVQAQSVYAWALYSSEPEQSKKLALYVI